MHESASERLTAVGVGSVRGRPKTFERDRVCREEECTTRLSTYNPSSVCWQHDPGRKFVPTAPRRKRGERRGPIIVDLR
jgi:hypothetical protein